MRIDELRRGLLRALDPLVHGSVSLDPARCAAHRGFIAAHLASGLSAFALMPAALVLQPEAATFSVVALAILGLEALVALFVGRTGHIDRGFLLSATVLSTLVAWVATFTGGLASFAIVWFAIAPVEAALSNSRRVIAFAALIGAVGLAVVSALTFAHALPAPVSIVGGAGLLNAAAACVMLIYAAMIAIRVETQHRDAENRAISGESRYRILADTMTDLVTCHGADGDITFVSPAALRVLNTRPCDLMGDGLFHRVHIADRPAYLTAVSDAIHRGHAAAEFRVRCGDEGEAECWRWVETLLRRSDDAPAIGGVVVAVTRDIEHRKLQETELRQARQDAETASFAKTRFLANVSHELRTPLNAIIGFSDILVQQIFGKMEFERHHEYARLIKESGEHLLQVVNDILDMSKIEAGSFDVMPEPFDLGAVVDRCGQLMAHQALQSDVRLKMAVEDRLPELVADRRACRQILINLLSNAIKFSHPGGEVVYGARREGRRLALFVRDQGIGISAEDLPRLGNPFVQAESGYNRRHEGTGLGLSVVKGLAALHGGSMSIHSELGVGTEVTVYFPVHGDGELTPFPKRSAGPEASAPARTAIRA